MNGVALIRLPMRQFRHTVPIVDGCVACDVVLTGEHREGTVRCFVLLLDSKRAQSAPVRYLVFRGKVVPQNNEDTYTCQQAEHVVRQHVFGRHDVLGQFEERVIVAPQHLVDGVRTKCLLIQHVEHRAQGQSRKLATPFQLIHRRLQNGRQQKKQEDRLAWLLAYRS